MPSAALQPDSAWAEDRATQRCDPSADPGAKTEGAARGRPHFPHQDRDWHQSAKPSRQHAATPPARSPSPLANADRSTFQFPLNQDMSNLRRTRVGMFTIEKAAPIEAVAPEKLPKLVV